MHIGEKREGVKSSPESESAIYDFLNQYVQNGIKG